jgi:predicted transcriptional regulator
MRKRIKATFPKAESHYNKKLDTVKVSLAVYLLQQKATTEYVAKKLKVSQSTITFIKRNERWKSVTGAKFKIRRHKPYISRLLSSEDVIFIRDAYKNGFSQNYLAKLYGISQPVVFDIVHKRTYRDVK